MKIVAAYRTNKSRTNERVEAVAKALGAIETTREQPIKDCDLVLQCGFQITPVLEDAMERGVPFLILENPVWHYGDKMSTYTIAYNGLNGLGFTPEAPRMKRPRPELKPMRDIESGKTVIFGQVENDKSLRGADIHQWVSEKMLEYPEAIFRPHPVMIPSWQHDTLPDFADVLDETSLAITYSSTVGAEALIAGAHVVAEHPGSFAYGVEDREAWLHDLSWRHWGVNEQLNVGWLLGGYDEARAQAEAGDYDNCSNGRSQPNPSRNT